MYDIYLHPCIRSQDLERLPPSLIEAFKYLGTSGGCQSDCKSLATGHTEDFDCENRERRGSILSSLSRDEGWLYGFSLLPIWSFGIPVTIPANDFCNTLFKFACTSNILQMFAVAGVLGVIGGVAAAWIEKKISYALRNSSAIIVDNKLLDCPQRLAEQIGMPVPMDFSGLSDLQHFADSRELSEGQQFLEIFQKHHLERCLTSRSSDAAFREFFVELAQLTQKPVDDVLEIFYQYVHEIDNLGELTTQLQVQREHLIERIEHIREFFCKLKEGKQYSPLKIAKVNFEKDLLMDLVYSLYEQSAEILYTGAHIFDNYWIYLPVDVQEMLLNWAEAQVVGVTFSENVPEDFKLAVLSMQQSFTKAKEIGRTKLPFKISAYIDAYVEDKPLDSQEVKPHIFQKKKYTLEEVIEGVTPENSHETTDWGPPVGEEFW